MARRNFTRAAKRGPKNNVWTVVLLQETALAASGQQQSNIVQQSDWSVNGGERATILTIRGYISVSAQNATTPLLEGGVLWYIGLNDNDIVTPAAPETAATYVNEQILTTGGHIFPEVAGGFTRESMDWEINVKTKRTIQSGTNVVMVMANRTSDEIKTTAVLRCLLRKGGN